MISFLYALPVVLLLVAVGMLFIDLHKPKHIWIAAGVGVLGLILLLITLLLVYLSQADQNLLLATLEHQEQSKENQIKQQSLLLTQLAAVKLHPGERYDRFTQYGLSVSNPFFLQLDKINDHIKNLTAKPETRSSSVVKIYRLPEDSNQLLLADYLRSFGYEAYIPEGNSADNSDAESSDKTDKTHDKPSKDSSAEDQEENKNAEHGNAEKKSTNEKSEEIASSEAAKETDDHSSKAPDDTETVGSEHTETEGEDPLVNGDQVVATSTTDLNKLKSLLNFKKGSVSVSTNEHSDAHATDKGKSPAGEARPPLASANLMYYGTGVSDYDIKVIALALMRSGIPLKGIRTFKETNRPYDIELDWSAFYEKRPTISPEKIATKKSFDR